MKKLFILPLMLVVFLSITGCVKNTVDDTDTTIDNNTGSDVVMTSDYNMDSWKEIIPETCQSFYDGCNHCNRMPDGGVACTKMFCEIYSEPYCKDDIQPDEGNQDLDLSTIRDIYVGLSSDEAMIEASKRGVPFRIVELDGVPQAATMDLRPGRINASVTDGFVTDIYVE